MRDAKVLPGTGRGTMRSMVEGAPFPTRSPIGPTVCLWRAPSTALRAVPLPVPGRMK
jgi:hypothetical protein